MAMAMSGGGGGASTGMEGSVGVGGGGDEAAANQTKVERLNQAVQQQLNLESVKTRAVGLSKAISRILEDFDAIARSNSVPKWQDVLGQFSMVNLELFNIVEDIKKVSKAFVVNPKNVNQETATILPVMLSSKLLPEMEAEDNSKREQLLHGLQNFPISAQIEKLKMRIDMIGAACESAEKVIADARKAFGLGTRQGPTIVPTLDKVQAAKIQEQENLLRAAVNFGEGLRIPGDQRHLPHVLPMHLVDVLPWSRLAFELCMLQARGSASHGDSFDFDRHEALVNHASPEEAQTRRVPYEGTLVRSLDPHQPVDTDDIPEL